MLHVRPQLLVVYLLVQSLRDFPKSVFVQVLDFFRHQVVLRLFVLSELNALGRDAEVLQNFLNGVAELFLHVLVDFRLHFIHVFLRVLKPTVVKSNSYSDLMVQLFDWYLFEPKPSSSSRNVPLASFHSVGSICFLAGGAC